MEQHPKRKSVRLEAFDYASPGAYFITICVKDRKPILSEIVGDDAHIVPKPYGLIVEKYIRNVPQIEKYVLMPDHIHMIIRLEDGSMWASTPTNDSQNRISSIIRSIKTLTSKEIGQSIFQRSYYDHVIRNREDYNQIWEYIENNPKKYLIKQAP